MNPLGYVPEAKVLEWIVSGLVRGANPKRILLFGSRARRDHRPVSDYDVAVELDGESYLSEFQRFRVGANEESPTLRTIDLIALHEPISSELRSQILKEGVEIYAR